MQRRLSLYWFCALGGLGAFFPFLSLYLGENRGLGGTRVGMLFALMPLMGAVCQPLWGQLADRTGDRTRVLALLCFGTAAGQLLLTQPHGFPMLVVAIAGLSLFSAAVQPAAMGVSMALLDTQASQRFGQVRVWGTLSFLVTVVSLPPLLDLAQERLGLAATAAVSEPGLELVFVVAALMSVGAGLVALSLPRTDVSRRRAAPGDYRQLLSHGPYLRVLIFMFGVYACLHGPMALFPIYVRSRGGDMGDISQLWIWMIALEVPLMLWSGAIFRRLSARWMVAGAVLAGGVRWLACAMSTSEAVIYPMQLLHALVVTGLLVGAPLCIDALVPPQLRSTGQAGLTMVSSGLGALVSSLGAGAALEHLGIDAVYYLGGGGALLLGLLGPTLLPNAADTRALALAAAD